MQSYLIVSTQSDFIKTQEDKIIKLANASSFNINLIDSESGIGIIEVRKLREIVSLKTFGGGGRVIIIHKIDKSSPEAQNALLKILEEPPIYTYIILVTHNVDSILPTIASRCQIIFDKHQQKLIKTEKIAEMLSKILSANTGQRILVSKNVIKTKEEAQIFLEELILFLNQSLFYKDTQLGLDRKQIVEIINKILAAKSYLDCNVNFKATLDILFLGFPQQSLD